MNTMIIRVTNAKSYGWLSELAVICDNCQPRESRYQRQNILVSSLGFHEVNSFIPPWTGRRGTPQDATGTTTQPAAGNNRPENTFSVIVSLYVFSLVKS